MKLTTIVIALALVAGCSKKDGAGDDDGKVASCDMVADAQACREYRGGNLALGTESLAKLCTTVVKAAKFTETACPTTKVIGTCKTPEHKDFFYEGYVGADTAEQSCKDGGGTYAR